MNEVLEYLKKCKTFYIATMEGDQPRVRPFGIAEEFEGKIYIQTGKIKPVAHQIMDNPKVEICAFKNGDWIRVCGEMYLDDRIEAKKAMLDSYPHLRGMYDENDGNTRVFFFKSAIATISSFTKPAETLEF